MKYYRVKEEIDNYILYINKGHYLEYYNILVGSELLTEREYKKLEALAPIVKNGYIKKDLKSCFDIVEINKNKTFWSFGARLEA